MNLKKDYLLGKGYEFCGEVVLKEIGIGTDYFESINPDTYLIEPEDVYDNLRKRGKSVHKYSAGKVLTIAGSYKYPGAAVIDFSINFSCWGWCFNSCNSRKHKKTYS